MIFHFLSECRHRHPPDSVGSEPVTVTLDSDGDGLTAHGQFDVVTRNILNLYEIFDPATRNWKNIAWT